MLLQNRRKIHIDIIHSRKSKYIMNHSKAFPFFINILSPFMEDRFLGLFENHVFDEAHFLFNLEELVVLLKTFYFWLFKSSDLCGNFWKSTYLLIISIRHLYWNLLQRFNSLIPSYFHRFFISFQKLPWPSQRIFTASMFIFTFDLLCFLLSELHILHIW